MNNLHSIEPNGPAVPASACRPTALAAALALLAGCATAPEPPPVADEVVVVKAFEVLSDPGDPNVGCRAGWHYIYAPEVTPHAREFRYNVVGSSMLSGGGAMPLPRPERDPRPQLRDDGRMEMKVNISSFGPCLNRDGERIIEFEIGECVEGDCPPMQFEIAGEPELVEFRLLTD